ncbi:TPA: YadA-like family protein [Stenotrophomonas maltophilia]
MFKINYVAFFLVAAMSFSNAALAYTLTDEQRNILRDSEFADEEIARVSYMSSRVDSSGNYVYTVRFDKYFKIFNKSGHTQANLTTPPNASAYHATATGQAAEASGVFATANGTASTASGFGSTAAGTLSTASGSQSTAVGFSAYGLGASSIAVGSYSLAGDSAIAIGNMSSASETGSVAIGNMASATARCLALGSNSVCEEANTVSVGSADITRRLVNVSAGENDTDAVNVYQLNSLSSALGGIAGFTSGSFSGWSVPLANGTFYNVYDALVSLDGRIVSLENNPSGGTGEQGPQGEPGPQGEYGVANIEAGANIEVSSSGEGNTTVSLSDQVQLSDRGSVQVGNTTLNAQGLTIQGGPSVTSNGVDAGNQRVTSVAAGRIEQGSTDAVNGGQVWDMQQDFNDRWEATNARIDRLDDRMNGLGAKSAAMAQMAAASTPLAVGEAAVTAGAGFASNRSALAVGYRVRVSERTSVSAGFAVGGGSSAMGGVGVQINLR